MIIGLVGPKRSGKDTAAEYLVQKYGAVHHFHSEIYHQILAILGIPNTRMNLISLVALRDVFGKDILIRALHKKIAEERSPLVALSGIRFQNELDAVKIDSENISIFVDAPAEKRFEWQRKDAQKADDRTMTFKEFLEIEAFQPTEIHIPELGEQCDYKIDNSGTLEDLYSKIDQIMEKHEIRRKE